MILGIKGKYLLYHHYWWILLLLMVLVIAGTVCLWFRGLQYSPIGLSAAGVLLSLFYFIQKQKLEELCMFRELFKEFNGRYACLQEAILDLKAVISEGRNLTDQNRKVLIDYFNLCGEEYFFYRRGYIYPDVWQSWCRGMLFYMQNEQIRRVWSEESSTESYYGLSLAEIRKGANWVGEKAVVLQPDQG